MTDKPAAAVVIVGGGQAGAQAAASLRRGGYAGRVTMVCKEAPLPYQRPPLSKAYLKEEMPFERLLLHPPSFYEQNAVELLRDEEVVAIDRDAGRVVLASGAPLPFDRLILATGADNRALPVKGAALKSVLMLRTEAESDRLREALRRASRVVVVGGGFIGLEVAAAARALGAQTTVLEAAERLMTRAVSPAVSAFLRAAHRRMGVQVELGVTVTRILGDASAEAVETAAGERFPCDLVVVAVGIAPSVALARRAGLAVANGVAVDRFLTTDDPRIFAIGDCAAFPTPYAEARVRLESVQNAVDQAKCVAARILGGGEAYGAVPWFWSDQGPEKLQIAGLTCPADHVRFVGSEEAGGIAAYCFRGGRFVGVEAVNRPADYVLARKALSGGRALTRSELERAGFDLRAVLESAGEGGRARRPSGDDAAA